MKTRSAHWQEQTSIKLPFHHLPDSWRTHIETDNLQSSQLSNLAATLAEAASSNLYVTWSGSNLPRDRTLRLQENLGGLFIAHYLRGPAASLRSPLRPSLQQKQ